MVADRRVLVEVQTVRAIERVRRAHMTSVKATTVLRVLKESVVGARKLHSARLNNFGFETEFLASSVGRT